MTSSIAWRTFPRLVASCFAAALLSFLVQYDGLSSSSGLSPWKVRKGDVDVDNFTFLSFLNLLPFTAARFGLSYDDGARFLSLFGTLASLISACTPFSPRIRGLFLILAWLTYSSLIHISNENQEPWMNYQWDILLLEVGIAAIIAVPWATNDALTPPPAPARIVIHLLTFKLLFMSGVTKLQAGDALWSNCKALEVHFASQPLPTPLSWFAHNSPPIFLSIGTAFSLWAEIFGAILLLTPCLRWRRVGTISNVLLQIAIFLTGSYNFFNFLTIALISVAATATATTTSTSILEQHHSRRQSLCCWKNRKCAAENVLRWAEVYLLFISCLLSIATFFTFKLLPSILQVPSTAAALYAASSGYAASNGSSATGTGGGEIFLNVPWWARVDIAVNSNWTATSSDSLLNDTLDISLRGIAVLFIFLWFYSALIFIIDEVFAIIDDLNSIESQTLVGLRRFVCTPFITARVALRGLICVMTLYVTAVLTSASLVSLLTLRTDTLIRPALQLPSPPLSFHSLAGWKDAATALSMGAAPGFAIRYYSQLAPYRVVGGYGLFRVMTGVGPTGVIDAWGLPVITTLRAEIILEGWWSENEIHNNNNNTWSRVDKDGWAEIPLPYAPRSPVIAPSWIAPHAPRLDWQFWFASLGGGGANAPEWLKSTVTSIMRGEPSVLSLLIPARGSAGSRAAQIPENVGWPVVMESDGAFLLIPPSAMRAKRVALDFTRVWTATWVKHHHINISLFFADPFAMPLEVEIAEETLSASSASPIRESSLPVIIQEKRMSQVTNILKMVISNFMTHPAMASLNAFFGVDDSAYFTGSSNNNTIWWQRHDAEEEEGQNWLPRIDRKKQAQKTPLHHHRNCTKLIQTAVKDYHRRTRHSDADATTISFNSFIIDLTNIFLGNKVPLAKISTTVSLTVLETTVHAICSLLTIAAPERGYQVTRFAPQTSDTNIQLPPAVFVPSSAHLSLLWIPVTVAVIIFTSYAIWVT